MSGFMDNNGFSQSSGIAATVRTYGKGFALEIVRCLHRFQAGDHDRVDDSGRSYYETGFCTIVLSLPKGPPWYAVVSLPQEEL